MPWFRSFRVGCPKSRHVTVAFTCNISSYLLHLRIAVTRPYDIIPSEPDTLQGPALNIGNCLTYNMLSQSARSTCWSKWQPRQHDAQSISPTIFREDFIHLDREPNLGCANGALLESNSVMQYQLPMSVDPPAVHLPPRSTRLERFNDANAFYWRLLSLSVGLGGLWSCLPAMTPLPKALIAPH
jgi:hypothetical protein